MSLFPGILRLMALFALVLLSQPSGIDARVECRAIDGQPATAGSAGGCGVDVCRTGEGACVSSPSGEVSPRFTSHEVEPSLLAWAEESCFGPVAAEVRRETVELAPLLPRIGPREREFHAARVRVRREVSRGPPPAIA